MPEALHQSPGVIPRPLALSIVIPVFNESEGLPALFREWDRVCREVLKKCGPVEIVLFEDGSRDQSWAQIAAQCERDPACVGVKGNWPAPALVTGMVLLVVFWRDLVERRPRWRPVVRMGLGLAIASTVALHLITVRPLLPARLNMVRRAQGWASFAEHVRRAREQTRIPLPIGNHYSQASMMRFYLSDHPRTYLLTDDFGKTQSSLWPGYELTPGTRALYVTDSMKPLPTKLLREFPESKLLDDFWALHRGRPITRFRVYELTHP